MQPRDTSYLCDILQAARLVREFVLGEDEDTFVQNRMCHSAVIRQLEIIGEATKRLSADFRTQHSDVPWKDIAGMRDILIHAYDHVDLSEVWRAATVSVPDLMERIEPLVSPETEDK